MRKQIYIEGQEIVDSKRTNLFEIKDWFQKGIIDYIHSSICSRQPVLSFRNNHRPVELCFHQIKLRSKTNVMKKVLFRLPSTAGNPCRVLSDMHSVKLYFVSLKIQNFVDI